MAVRLLIASDHGGVELKAALVKFLKKRKVTVSDLGTHSEASVDYPDYALALAKKVGRARDERGILICKSGIGMSVSANKVRGVRAALCLNKEMAKLSRLHTNSNVLVLGAQFVTPKRAEQIVDTWLTTPFEGGRHEKRINKITHYEGEK